jgi:lysozyme family protein
VLGAEGGYSDHKSDRGGKTNFGITQSVYDEWRIGKGFGRQPVVGISGEEVKQIYLSRYWMLGKCDRLPAPLDYVHFDGCVNHGKTQAAKFLQRALGVEDDGAIGPKTLAAVREEDLAGRTDTICDDILHQREEFYDRLAERDESQKVFLKGWHNRLAHVRKLILS